MMKRLFSLVCVAMLAIAASAQVTWNVKGGLGVATCYGGSELDGLKSHAVGKLGAGLEYPLSNNLSLMPSLELAWKGAEMEDDLGGEIIKETVDIYYLQVPVVLAYRLNISDAWNLALKAGPYFAYDISDHYEGSYTYNGQTETDSGSLEIDKFDVGLDAGIDFEHHRFVFGLEAEVGLVEFGNGVKNLAFYATVGYKF